ncbi:hypothetical protein WA158_001441 [Blastocystis sp. Blastoise]
MKNVLFLCFALILATAYASNSVETVQGLVGRLLGEEYVESFVFEEIPKENDLDVFELTKSGKNGEKIVLKGSDAVAMSVALNNYLKYYCNSSISWGENGTGNNIRLPAVLPEITETWHHIFAVQYRYYMNVCTVSYSSSFWDWNRWEKEIDWMALNGVNMPLTFTGQEYIWLKVFLAFGFSQSDILDYFSGPAFFAWQRMGNIQRWGGPLTTNWIRQEWEINLKIVQRQKEFGMYQVLPAFAGFVPESIATIYPNATIRKATGWNGFQEKYTANTMVDPQDPLFTAIGKKYIEIQTEELGFTSHFYNTDQFNEMDPKSTDLTYLHDVAKVVYDGIKSADSEGIWVMQGWQFHSGFWNDERLAAYLSGIPDEGLIILDLNSEQSPLFEKFAKNHKKWIWCMLHNYGGHRAMYGDMYNIAQHPVSDHKVNKDTMVGTGMTPEAIEHNPIMYDLMNEMGWRTEEVNVEDWTEKYILRRYGGESKSASAAWKHLLHGVYNSQWSWNSQVIAKQPHLSIPVEMTRKPEDVTEALPLYLQSYKEYEAVSEPWKYDLVDLTRQSLEYLFSDLYFLLQKMISNKKYIDEYDNLEDTDCPGNDLYRVKKCGYDSSEPCNITELLTICNANPLCGAINSNGYMKSTCGSKTPFKGTNTYAHTDRILGTNLNFLLGVWTRRAASFAKDEEERRWLDFNAKNQITLWGPRGEINDYAAKMWNGLVGTYYYGRWSYFFETALKYIKEGKSIDWSEYYGKVIEMGVQWDNDGKEYPNEPIGDSYLISKEIENKYIEEPIKSYKKMKNMSVAGYFATWTKDIKVMAFICSEDSHCKGFNSNGLLIESIDTPVPTEGIDLYLKN